MRVRLCLMMFLQYAPAAAVLPLYSTYLQEQLNYTNMGIAVCCATQAAAFICSALFAGHIADRWMSAERLLGLCSFLAGLDLWLLAVLDQPIAVFCSTLIYWLLTGPIWMLGAAIGFAHLKHPERQYGPVRMWGTVGWMGSAWLVSYWFQNPDWLCHIVGWLRPDLPLSERADLFRIGGIMSFVLTAYTMTLPHTPPRPGEGGGLAPLAALQLLHGRQFFVYAICFLGVCITFPFGTQGSPLLLRELDTSEAYLPAILTIAQATEVICLGLLPVFMRLLGVRGTVLVGLIAMAAGLAVQASFHSQTLVAASLSAYGLIIGCVFVAGQVFVNSRVHDGLRASVQSLLTFINGSGLLLGNLLFGALRRWAGGDLHLPFAVGAGIMTLLVAVFAVGFEGRREKRLDKVG